MKRLAEGAFSGEPVWNPVRRAVVYLRYDEVRRQRDLIWQCLDTGGEGETASDVILPIVLIEGGEGAAKLFREGKSAYGAFRCSRGTSEENPLRPIRDESSNPL